MDAHPGATRPSAVHADDITHELKNPLMGIRGLASTGLAAYDSLTDDERRDFFRLIGLEADRLGRVIGQVGVLLRLREGTVRYALTSSRIGDLLPSADAEPGLVRDVAEEDLRVLCDPAITRTVIVELVRNARAYSPDGSPITLKIDPEAPGGLVEICVTDEGPGLPEAQMEAAFEAFTNLRPAGYEAVPAPGSDCISLIRTPPPRAAAFA